MKEEVEEQGGSVCSQQYFFRKWRMEMSHVTIPKVGDSREPVFEMRHMHQTEILPREDNWQRRETNFTARKRVTPFPAKVHLGTKQKRPQHPLLKLGDMVAVYLAEFSNKWPRVSKVLEMTGDSVKLH
ncbi:uncharacterized protein LOC121431353 isoform X1 [Lytechinus variegatus]|uniref:uncharacterized protein LOC121431353 isoform X1 n=1 Tax=Lytechinus variegatus TaxID=7654 RepID=UPI001BB2BAEC|nr:uncharacterized protein LOC121431353 isoform X1 [Lytechinus variegatus]